MTLKMAGGIPNVSEKPAKSGLKLRRRCDTLPTAPYASFGEAIALFQAFDGILRRCAALDGGLRLRAAFGFADVTGDGNLTVAEVAPVFRALTFFVGHGIAAESAPDKRVPLSNLHGVVAVANIIARFIAQSPISSSDFDGNGAASRNELLRDRGGDRLRGVMGTVQSAAVESALKGVFQTLFGTIQQGMTGLLKLAR